MNFSKLYEIQRKLDNHIVEKHGLQGQDLLPKKILALLVELGELANEQRSWKYWSEDQETRTKARDYIPDHGIAFKWVNPLLEEYVDCLHFILGIGLDLGYEHVEPYGFTFDSIIEQFNSLFNKTGDLYCFKTQGNYTTVLSMFLALGEMLGFTWEQIEQAYMSKNAENHARQDGSY